jgi:hypothetical protein
MKIGMGLMLLGRRPPHYLSRFSVRGADQPQQAAAKDGASTGGACLRTTPFDFGAKGDGVADDTIALQRPWDAAIAKKIALVSPMRRLCGFRTDRYAGC